MIPIMFGLSIILFALINSMPGNPYQHMINPKIRPEDKERMLKAIGYYDPLPVKYVKWVGRAIKGDLGYSIRYKVPVTDVIGRRIGNTFILSLAALLLSTIIAVPIGVISATKQYSIFDYIVTILAFIGISIPAFFLALLLIKFLAFDLGLFPISGIRTAGAHYTGLRAFLDLLHHMALPLIVLTLLEIASTMRYTRSSMLEVIRQDYIRTARAKGLNEKVVIYKHALRNALIPVVTILSLSLGFILSGAILTETVFAWPGMGTLMYQGVLNRDYPLIMASNMLIALCVLIANLFADIVYAFIDPRIRYS